MKKEKPASKTSSAKKVKSKAEQEELRKPAKLQPIKKPKNWKKTLLEDDDDLLDDDLATDTLDDDLALDDGFDEEEEDRY